MQLKLPIYLDYMATTPVAPQVAEKMQTCLLKTGYFGNPSSHTHRYGWEAAELVEKAQNQVAALIHANPREIIWTSGATESNNLAIIGAAQFYQRKGKHIITMSTEHKAVLNPCQYLQAEGFEVTYLDPRVNGLLDLNQLADAIREDTILVSIMHVNNETGVIQDIAAIGKLLMDKGIIFHVDAAQSVAKLPINLQDLAVDLMSFSAHKAYGPKGIGALYVRRTPRVRLAPQIHGGSQQNGIRAGTLPTHQIVGMGEAFKIIKERLISDHEQITMLRDRFWKGINQAGDLHINGDLLHLIPGCLNIQFDGVDGEALLLSLRDLAISSGSACTSTSSAPSHVLSALGLTRQQAHRSLRFSFGRDTTSAEIDYAVDQVVEQVNRLRNLPPAWEITKQQIPSADANK